MTGDAPDNSQTPAVQPGEDGSVAPAGQREKRRFPPWLVVGALVVALVFAAVILSRVAGPLYGLLFPIKPPVPDGAQEIEHVKPEKGSEYWVYRTTMTGEEVAAFYEEEGSSCSYSVGRDQGEGRAEGASYSVARCLGKKESAGLLTSWEVLIAEGYDEQEGPTIFRLYKYSEVTW